MLLLFFFDILPKCSWVDASTGTPNTDSAPSQRVLVRGGLVSTGQLCRFVCYPLTRQLCR